MTRLRLILAGVLIALVAGFYAYPRLIYPKSADAAVPQTAGQKSGTGQRGGTAGGHGGAPTVVITAVATSEDVPITTDAVGWAEPSATVAVRAQIDGVIVQQPVANGQIVKKGDVLFKLDDAVIQATIAKDTASMAKDQANLDQANADLKRDQSLSGKNAVITQQQLEQQQAVVKADEASVAVDKAQLQADTVQLGYTTISAPIAGRVGVVNVTAGNLVRSSDSSPLLTITQMAPLRVSYAVPERDLAAYRTALAGPDPVSVDALDPQSGARRATGRLTFIDSSVDTASGTIVLKADFANGDGALWPGEYIRARTTLGVRKNATVVPITAVQQTDQGSFVFLVKPDKTVARQTVTLAAARGEKAIIASGLQPGDHVVTEGQLHLVDGAAIKEAPPEAGKPAAVSANDTGTATP